MHTQPTARFAFRILACSLILCASAPLYGITDLLKWPAGQVPVGEMNGADSLDDIWQGLFNAWALDPTKDADGDGCSNLVESIAGTNPFLASDCLKVGSTVITGGNVIFTVKAEQGKKYRVLSYETPNGASTVVAMTAPVAATQYIHTTLPATVNIVITKPGDTRKFYRLETSDVDTDSDGVTDWAERKLGLNPNVQDSDLDGVLDGALVASELQTPDVVTISATEPVAGEDATTVPGSVTITRKRKLLPMTVNYSITGTATPGTDFSAALVAAAGISEPAPNSVKLEAGKTSAVINVAAVADAVVESGESVTVSLTSAASTSLPNPTIGYPDSATVIINNSTTPSGTGLLARYYDHSNGTYAHAANFGDTANYAFTRNTSPTTQGTIVVTPTTGNLTAILSAVSVGTQVRLTFLGGNLNNALYNNLTYPVTTKTASNFTVSITAAAALPTSSSSTANFSIQPIHPAVIERVDPTVNFDWQHGTPNGAVIAPNNSPDNYSSTWEAYLQPTTAGNYVFQLDADNKARMLIDFNSDGDFADLGEQIVEHGWDSAATVGTFKQSASIALTIPATPAQRLKMRVEHVETTGDARCRLQWSLNGGAFSNIPQANQFTHTQALTYTFVGGNAIITPTGGHTFSVGNSVPLSFSSGVLFTPGAASSYNGTYTVTAVSGTSPSFTVSGASTSAGSPTVLVPSTAGLVVGMGVSGTGLPANEYITAIGSGQITITTGTGVTLQASTTLTFTSNFTVAVTGFPITVNGAVTTAGSNLVAVPSTTGLAVGMAVSGTGLPANEFITAVGIGNINITTGTGVTAQASTTLTAALPAGPVAGNGFVLNNSTSTTTGAYNLCYANTTFSNSPGRVGVDGNGTNGSVTAQNSGIWLTGTPDVALIQPDSFSIRWTGQVQPQFSEEYTFVVQADEGCALLINGQPQVLKIAPTANTGGSTYTYNATTGDLTVNYAGLAVVPNSFVVGETTRIDPSTGNLNHAPTTAPTYNYNPITGDVVVDYTNLVPPQSGGTRTAGSYLVGETVEFDPTSGGLSPLGTLPYVITAATGNTFTVNAGSLTFNPTISISSIAIGSPCVITTATNHNLTTGTQVRLSGVSGGTFAPAINDLYTITVTGLNTFTVASNCTAAPTSGTGTLSASGNVTVSDNRNLVIASTPTSTSFVVNIGAGKYADASAGNINLEIINKSLKDFSSNGNERYVRIPMTGGLRYDIQLDYYEATSASRCFLSWYSASQPKQIIPAERLYPTSGPIQPPSVTAPTVAVALVNGAFSLPITGSNGGTVTVSGLPPGGWLTYNSLTGVLSGTPPAGSAGDYQIVVTTTSAAGTGKSVINVHVQNAGGTITRDVWTPVAGTTVASIPVTATPNLSNTLSTLEAPVDYGDNYGERIRGWITAPVTGNYYFWLAASNSAELWISNDDEPVNIFKRAYVTTGTGDKEWNNALETHQKSAWLALEAGKRYYVEILHKAGVGSDNCAVGWSKPGEATTTPSEVVPGYVLSPYAAPAPATPGTLYIATLLAQPGAVAPPGQTLNGVGTATLRINEAETIAELRVSYSGLTGTQDGPAPGQPVAADGSSGANGVIDPTDWHIHADPYLDNPTAIIYDGAEPVVGDGPQFGPGGVFLYHKWNLAAAGTLDLGEIRELLKQGKAYINLHTTLNPAGEIRGNFTLANGTRTFSPPPSPPAWTDDSLDDNQAVRFLTQASFGGSVSDIGALQALAPSGASNSRYETWINNQFGIGATQHLPEVLAREIAQAFGPFDVSLSFNAWWKNSMTGPDQLRQRVAFALSEIHVVSGQGPLEDNARAISDFYDTLAANAFGNFKDVLVGTTLTPGMGRYLDMLRNDKPDISVGRSPNENYAREIKQLFSIGLYRMWPDGTLMLTSQDSPIDTYTQREIVGLAHVFTGWDYGYDGAYHTSFSSVADWTRPMREVPARHFTGTKRVLNNEVFPGLTSIAGQPLDPNAVHTSTQYNDPAYQALPGQENILAHDMLFNHPNTGPFICRQLIQRMVTSNPSRDYLFRVVQKFNDNGSGVRGDMQAVITAILLDYEARSSSMVGIPAYGKQREPIMRVANVAHALRPTNVTGTYAQTGALSASGLPIITITTSTPHLLTAGNSVFLEFADATVAGAQPAPTAGTYSVITVTDSTHYTIAAPGWIAGAYSQTAGSNVMTVTLNGHWLPGTNASQPTLPSANWGKAYFDFTSGTANSLAGFDQTVRTVATSTSFDTPSGVGNISGTTFTLTAPDTTARSGNVMISRFSGSYNCSVRGGAITIDTAYGNPGTFGTMADHGLSVGDNVFLNFSNSRDTTSFNETSTENDLVYPVASVPDANTFTVTARDAANAVMNSDNQVFIFPGKAQPLVRNGTITTRPSTYTMDNTDIDLQQTPLNSTTVFNYFLPDYKFAGTLASQGITTPEFQLTSETTAIRQANFLYNGVFNPASTTGISSFKAGTNALVIDLSPWMGNAVSTAGTVGAVLGAGPQTGQAWTSNANLPTLIDRLNTLLMAGQLPAGAKTAILKLIGGQVSSVTTGSPCTFTMGSDHGLLVGDSVTVTGISGGTWSGASTTGNGTFFVTAVPATNTFRLATAVTGGTNLNCTSTTTPTALNLANSTAGIIAYTNSGPSNTNIRDRLRAIIHLILTSPDYTIQR